jgi:hypothetical protein
MAEATDPASEVRTVNIELEVEGDDADGWLVVITPDGCFTADHWFASKAEAIGAAQDVFGAPADGWTSE